MLAVTRFDVTADDGDAFLAEAERALAALAAQRGYRTGTIGRAIDHPTGWLLLTTWDGVGSYRRALSAFEVRISLLPLTARAVDEPGAYEVIVDSSPRPRPVRPAAVPSGRSGPCGPKPDR